MNSDQFARIVSKINTLPTLPAVVSRVLSITNNPESSAKELLDAIVPDQAITAKIIKMANSVAYHRLRKVATLKQALTVLGSEEIRNIVLASAVFNNFQHIKRVTNFDANFFWTHSFATGLAAKMLAPKANLPPSELFVAGLLHNIGKLVLLLAFPSEFTQLINKYGNYGFENLTAEKEIFGLDHTEAGMRLLKRWMFPNQLVICAGFHHDPDPQDSLMVYPFIVLLADRLSHTATLPQGAQTNGSQPQNGFKQDIYSLANVFGVDWNPQAMENNIKELKRQIDAHGQTLAIFSAN